MRTAARPDRPEPSPEARERCAVCVAIESTPGATRGGAESSRATPATQDRALSKQRGPSHRVVVPPTGVAGPRGWVAYEGSFRRGLAAFGAAAVRPWG